MVEQPGCKVTSSKLLPPQAVLRLGLAPQPASQGNVRNRSSAA
jgi:hypothetical protein